MKSNVLLKLFSLPSHFFNVATRKFLNIYMAHITFCLDNVGLELCSQLHPSEENFLKISERKHNQIRKLL